MVKFIDKCTKAPSQKIIQALDAAVEIKDFLPPPAELVKREKRRKSLKISDRRPLEYRD
ncbi:MAG: hypothetical protein MJZ22_03555 [Candidatus Saccharibacteria bacterium]|nr:hypothetical protein [Candidatus Saccharibacteria bacterium]